MFRWAWRKTITTSPSRQYPRIPACSLYVQSGFLALKYGRKHLDPQKMPQDLTRSQPDSVDSSPKHVDKKPRLDSLDIKEQHVGPTSIPPPETQPSGKRRSAKRETKKKKEHLPEPYSIEDVITRDVVALLGERTVQGIIDEGKEHSAPFTFKQEVDLIVTELSSSGMHNPLYVLFLPL